MAKVAKVVKMAKVAEIVKLKKNGQSRPDPYRAKPKARLKAVAGP